MNPLKFPIIGDLQTRAAFSRLMGDLRGVKGAVAGVNDRAKALGRSLRNLGLGASAALSAPLAAFGGQALRDFDAQVKAVTAVETALKSTGGAAGKTLGELQALAAGFEARTVFGDEDILRQVTAPLLTFTKIQGETFDRAQQSVADMASLLEMDLKSAALQVGKALNDPVKGVTALGRAGVSFSDDQKAMIKSLVKTGEVAAAQGIILKELEIQFGGQAEAMARVGLGPMQQLRNAIGTLREDLGAELVTFMPPLIEKVRAVTDWFSQLSPEVKANIVLFGGLAAAVGPILSMFGLAILGVTQLAGAFAAMGAVVLANPIIAAIAAIVAGSVLVYRNWDTVKGWWVDLWAKLNTSAATGWARIRSTIETYSPQWLKDLWATVADNFRLQWVLIRQGARIAWDGIKSMFATNYSPQQVIKKHWTGLGSFFSGKMNEVKLELELVWTSIKNIARTWIDDFTSIGGDIIDGLKSGISAKWHEVKSLVTSLGRNLPDWMKDVLGIKSPSRVFKGIGEDVMAGLSLGLNNGTSEVLGQMTEVSGSLVQASGVASQMQSAFTNAFSSIVRGAGSARDIVGGFLDQMASQLLTIAGNSLWQMLGLGSIFGGGVAGGVVASAKGNVFSGGNFVPFAKGGIVNGPTVFPMKGPDTGLMGEAGPEAIMPLVRGRGGRLGVEAQGGGGTIVLQVRTDPGAIVEIVENTTGQMIAANNDAQAAALTGQVNAITGRNDPRVRR